MIIKKTPISVSKYLNSETKKLKKKIAFIPTMGALHDGHLSLVKKAKKKGYFTIVSIYVNPSQFAPNEDFSKYPRSLKSDLKKLRMISADLVFTPLHKHMFEYETPKYTFKTFGIEKKLCGKSRPYHFLGVSDIVLKFLSIIKPNVAYFGEKDYQQFFFIKTVVEQTQLKTKIVMAKTVRDVNGLALSSRNNYLSKEQARVAKNIYKSLKILKKIIKNGEDVSKALNQQKNFLLNEGFTKIEYLEIRTQDLKKSILPHHRSRIFIAAKIENIRLIDNLLI